ncbi:MAG TPA: hypothetical protein VM345_06750 [Acidimicrobiales bacterium]|jgi:hypothetical protein|nr:hypothetical protein [Acidimicrobiales bacterium]
MHRTRSTRARLLVLPLAAALALGACGGGDSNDEATTTDDTMSEQDTQRSGQAAEDSARENGEPTATKGAGELVIGGTTFTFTSASCAIGTEDVPLVEVSGQGSDGGREYEVEIVRSKPASNYVERTKLAWSGTEAAVATAIGAGDSTTFKVEDRTVTASGLQFTGAGGAPSGEGTLTVTCEKG